MSERIVRLGFNQHGVLEWRVEPPVVVAGGPSLNASHYRIRDDNLSSPDSTPTWLGNQDSNPTAARGTGTANSFVLRVQFDETNNKSGSWTLQLNYDYNSGTATGTVGSASSYVRMYGATSRGGISDDTAVTVSRLTAATGTFENGICDTATGSASFNNSSNGAWTEYEWIVYIVDADVSNGDTIQLNVTGQSATGVTWPTITVSKVTTVQGSATLTGSADTSGTADVTHYGTATVTGSADLTATGHIDAFGDATLTGSADLTATGHVTVPGNATVTGSAELTATASVQHYGVSTATGSADLTATASVVHYNSATLTGSADLTATGNTNIKGQATLTGSADTSGTASVQHYASLIAAGAAFLIATASVTHNAQATLTGSADVVATGSVQGSAFGEATVTGSADLSATASVQHFASATLTGSADVSATGSIGGSVAGSATVTGSADLSATADVQHFASATLTGSADLSGTGWVHVWGDAILTGSADLSGTGVVNEYGTCLLTGTADLFGTATLTLPSASATATGSADVSASASVQHYGAASLTGQASVSGSGTAFQATVYGEATLTGSAEVVAAAYIGQLRGTATMTGAAELTATGWLSKVGGVATLTGKAYTWAGDYPGQGYFAYLYNGEYFRLAKWSPLTGLVILDEVAFVHAPSTYYNIVLEADGNTLNAKVWEGNPNIPPGVADDENEPVGWMISVTDPDYAGGTPGLVALGTADVKFDVFSTGLGGSTYPLGRLPGAPTWVTPSVPFSVPENDPIVPLSWLRPFMTGDVLGGVVNYELEYKREADTEWTFLTSTNETSYDWDLSRYPNSESYCVRVRAYVGCEYGPWAEICGIGWGGQAPTFETPDGYYFGDDNVGEPDHGMWIRLFQASHRDDEYQVNACLVTREIMPGGVNGECLFQKLYVNLTYSTAGQCVVTPILDGERITEETRIIDLDPGEGIVTRRFELDLARGFTTSSERFRYGMRGTYFQVEICVTDISGTGRIEIDGISLAYTKARETHPWARPFYGELETDVQPDINDGYFFGTGTDDVPAALYELATNDRDFGRELRVRIQPRAMAPFGTAAESWFRMLYICFTRSNTLDRQIKVTPIIDGQELDAVYLTLEGTTQPKTEIHEVPLKMSYPSATLERSTYGIRGLWFTYRLETVTQRPDGELSIDGTAVEVLYDRESEPNTP